MNKPDSMDEMMRAYFGRQEEPFVFKKRNRGTLHVSAITLSLLLITMIVSLLQNFTLAPANSTDTKEAENSVKIIAATAVIEKPLSGSPDTATESVGDKNDIAKKVGVFVIDGENLYGLKSRSLYQDATFFRIRNSDLKQNWRLEWDAHIDLSGKEYVRDNIIYSSDTFANVDENGYYKWILSEETANRFALAYAPEKNLNDVVETIIYFNDGSHIRKIYDISYENGAMMIYENSSDVYGWDLNSENNSN